MGMAPASAAAGAGDQLISFLWLDEGIESDSRYFATVLLATMIPVSQSIFAMALSERGFALFSDSMIFLIFARMAVDEHSPPELVLTWLEKKNLSS